MYRRQHDGDFLDIFRSHLEEDCRNNAKRSILFVCRYGDQCTMYIILRHNTTEYNTLQYSDVYIYILYGISAVAVNEDA